MERDTLFQASVTEEPYMVRTESEDIVGEQISHDRIFHDCLLKVLSGDVLKDIGCNPFLGKNLQLIRDA